MKDLRSIVVRLVIGSFGLAALLGVIALLGGGSFGETEGQILLTTVIVGVECVALLCYLAVAGRSHAWVGVIGAIVSLIPFGIALTLTWSNGDLGESAWRTFGVSVTVAATLAQASLLLGLTRGRRVLLGTTLAAATVVALMIIGPLLDQGGDDDLYWRLFGVVAILDALGTVVLVALRVFDGISAPADTVRAPQLTAAVEARLADAAASRHTSPTELLSRLLDDLG